MKLKKSEPKREKRPMPVSFRLSLEAFKSLTVLGAVYNKTKSELIEEMVSIAIQDALKEYPKEVSMAQKKLGRTDK